MKFTYPIILDGATGTQMQKRGYTGSGSLEKWIIENPEAYIESQRAYIDAGSGVICAPTFGANRVKMGSYGIYGEVEEYNSRLVAIAKRAAQGRALTAGDMSPTGKFLYPIGDTHFEELYGVYAEQAAAIERAGADMFIVETMTDLPDLRAAVMAIKSVSTKPIFATVTCDGTGHMLTGTDVTAALVVMQALGVAAFGLNCSVGPEDMLEQLRRMRPYARIPLIAKPNAGTPVVVDGRVTYNCPPEEFARCVPDMVKSGACVFGGCCGTDETHIAAIKRSLAGLEMQPPAPEHDDLLLCATEKKPFYLDPSARPESILDCGEDLEDDLSDELEEDGEMVAVRINSQEDVDSFADCQYMITKPLCLVCDDAELLERAVRSYQGLALYSGDLSDTELAPLVEKYGIIPLK